MPRALAPFVLLLLTSCAAPPPATPEPPLTIEPPRSVAAEPDTSPPPSPPPPAAKPPLPPPVALDSAVACAFDAARWEGTADITDLALRPGGKPFARITGGPARLSIPVGPAGDALLEIRDAGLSVAGHVPAKAAALRPNAPFELNGFAVPTIFARLAWSEGANASLTVVYEAPEELEVLDPPLRATRPCADVGLEGRSFEAKDGVPGGSDADKKDVKALLPGSRVSLASTPTGKPVARIAVKEATHVSVFESRGGMSRVSLPVDRLLVFGWVKTSELKPAGSLAGYGSGRGRRGLREPSTVVVERWRCAEDVPLVAAVEDERRAVGAIGKETPIEVLAREEDEVVVRVWTTSIHAAEGARFSVRAADLAGCARILS